MPTCFVIGQTLMLLAAKELEQSAQKLFTFPFKLALAYALFVFVPATTWAFYNYTDWSIAYLRNPSTLPIWAGPFLVSQYFLGMFLGALIAQLLIQQGHKKFVLVTLMVGFVWLSGLWTLTLDEYLHIGTFTSYHAGQATPIFQSPSFQKSLNILGVILALPLIGIGAYLYQRSKSLK